MGAKQLRSRTLSTHDTTFVCLNIAALSAINNTTLALATHTQPNTAAFVSNRNQFRDSRAKCYMKYIFFFLLLFVSLLLVDRLLWAFMCSILYVVTRIQAEPQICAHTHTHFDWVEPDDNNKRCQMNARHRQQQQRRSDMHSMNYYGQLAPKWMSCQCEKIMFRFETCLAHTLHHIREQIIIYKIKI